MAARFDKLWGDFPCAPYQTQEIQEVKVCEVLVEGRLDWSFAH